MSATNHGHADGVGVQLQVSLPGECPLVGVDGEIISANRQVIDGECQSLFVVRPTGGDLNAVDWRHRPHRHEGPCICQAFCDVGVIPVFDRVRDDEMVVSAFIDSEDKAGELYDRLKDIVPTVDVLRLYNTDYPSHLNSMTKVDLSKLTKKQLVAVELAVAEGYYEEPKETSIAELADTLGISRQAFSHRLSEAESRIFRQVVAQP